MAEREWAPEIVDELERSDELTIAVSREGRDTVRLPIWVVTVDGRVYVRSYKGVTSMWFRRVQANGDQVIALAAGDVPVSFVNVDRLDHVNRLIDAAFDRKYARFDYVSAMSEPAAVEATLLVLPRVSQ
jgi:hypothetical protein